MKSQGTIDFSGYRQFTGALQNLAFASDRNASWEQEVDASLDGVAGAELRKHVALSTRRKFGTFFTGSVLAERLVGAIRLRPDRHFIYDPTVGAGDLLLAAARRLPCGSTLSATLASWGQCIAGTDLHPELIEAAKLRLGLLARQRHGASERLPTDWMSLFPHVRLGNGLEQRELFQKATHLLLNPPYGTTMAPQAYSWTKGRVSEAGLFVVRAFEMASTKARLFAILPDVLRSGSFQHHWRERVSDLAEIQSVERYGIFDDSADIDVFLLGARRRASKNTNGKRWPEPAPALAGSTVGDYFSVHVGRVVPHRDPETGPVRRYIHPRNIPVWQEVTRISETRRHALAYQPPFVVLRRTSRPGHPYRAAATIILGTKPVAVENHLIVCEPNDRSAATCRALMEQLHTQRVNDFLDQRIRCRHLTVGAVAAIPFEPV